MSARDRGTGIVTFGLATLLLAGGMVVPSVCAQVRGSDLVRPATSGWINVTAVTDYGYQPDTFQQVPTNASITVTFTDDDVLSHSFSISSREGFVIPTSYTPTQLTQLYETYPPLYSTLLNGSGEQSTGTFRSPVTAGWYEFVCDVSGHFQNGMYGFVAFGENLPANLTKQTRTSIVGGLSNPGLLGGIAAAVGGIALVLGYVVWRRRRSTYRSNYRTPPERLESLATQSPEASGSSPTQLEGPGPL